jgi:hypothetical protein
VFPSLTKTSSTVLSPGSSKSIHCRRIWTS